MSNKLEKSDIVLRIVGVFIILILFISACGNPESEIVDKEKLIDSITAAGDYLVKYQESSGELSYRVDIPDGNTDYSVSHIRLIAGTGSLFTVCRVTEDDKYCDAGDRALDYYLGLIVEGGDVFGGSCLDSNGYCKIGGAALAIDAIYKRWQATGEITMGDRDLLEEAKKLGEHIIWMIKPEGGFYHRVDTIEGIIDEEYFVTYFNGESLMALLELYEMTGEEDWYDVAREVNSYMVRQAIKHDHWHAYAFSFFARLDMLTKDDQNFATRIAEEIIDFKAYRKEDYSTISAATKVEALASIALALKMQGESHDWLAPAINEHAVFMMARQLPNNLCGWEQSDNIGYLDGGIYHSCAEPYIRVDGLQHWINGAAAYLEYLED